MLPMAGRRQDPLYRGQSSTTDLHFSITTLCSMRCPNCNVGIPGLMRAGQARHVPVAEIERLARGPLHGLRKVAITGGEATLHPDFATIALNGRTWFGCQRWALETNGFRYMRHRDVIRSSFDRVFITHYQRDAIYPGSQGNLGLILAASLDLGGRLIREPPVRHPRGHVGPTPGPGARVAPEVRDNTPCSMFTSTGLPSAYFDGLLYRCCVVPGIEPGSGMEPAPGWRNRIDSVELPCSRCCYSGT